MDDVCTQLDDTVLQIFQVLESLYAKQDSLQQVMKDGFLGISRSRYLLGVKWVSVDQILDAELIAKYKTIIDDSVVPTDADTIDIGEKSLTASEADSLNLFELTGAIDNIYLDKQDDSKKILVDTDADTQKHLRKRHTDNEGSEHKRFIETENAEKQASVNKNSKKEDESPAMKTKKEGNSNALSLFGVLTPQPLRTSQKCFEESVKIAVCLADLKLKLSLLQNEYKRLYKIKESLLLAVSDGQ